MASSEIPAGQTAALASSDDVSRSVDDLSRQIDQLRLQLRQAQKLACLGTGSAMLAHEYNNVLAPIVSYAQYALDKGDVQLMRKTLNMMLTQFDAVQAMSDRVLGLASEEADPSGPVRLRDVVEDTLACLGRDLAKDNIKVQTAIDRSLCVQGCRNQIQQVLLNLVINARQAMTAEGQGILEIAARRTATSQVQIRVTDNGRGIAPGHLRRIFDPFFTTKGSEKGRERKGVGLGLAVCKDIVEDHGGTISATSVAGQGTVFTVTLPLCALGTG